MLLGGKLINHQARTAQCSLQTDQHKALTMETEELYDNELIDEIADEVLLALEEERPDETYDGEVDQWAEACRTELAQLLDGAAPPQNSELYQIDATSHNAGLNFGKPMVSFQHQPTSGRILTS
mgnify:CR=1 FL=1